MVLQILIRRNQQGEFGVFCGLQQLAIGKFCPATIICCLDSVAGQKRPQRDGRSLIEKDAQLNRRNGAASSVRKDCAYLLQRHAWKPF